MTSLSGFGPEFEKKIGRERAASLAEIRGVPLPRIGYQVTLAEVRDEWNFRCPLYLQNIGSQFILASSSVPVVDWGQRFRLCFKEAVQL
jgi:hypothetical protein